MMLPIRWGLQIVRFIWGAADFLHMVPRHDFTLGLGCLAATAITQRGWRRLAEDPDRVNLGVREIVKRQLAGFQLLSAGFVAFVRGSNDVGNAISN
jgi:hypothetical protein